MKFIHDNYKIKGYTFKERTSYTTYHLGVDLESNYIPLYAPCDGKSVSAPYGEQGGQWLHFEEVGTEMCAYFGVNKLIHRFGHLSAYKALKNYKEGDEIATSGNTGQNTTNPHTHWDVSKEKLDVYNIDNFVDPEEYKRVKFYFMNKIAAPDWFKEEGYYDRAKAAGIQWVNGEAPEWAWKVLGADFKIKDHEQGANEAVPPTGNLKITVVIPEINEHVKYCIEETEKWLSRKIPTKIKLVQKNLVPEWHLKSDSNRNLIKADWLQKNVEPYRSGAQILCLVVEPKNYKKKGTNGASFDYAYEKGVGQITWQKWTKGRQDKKYGGFAQNYQLAGTLRHEIVHALFQLTGFNEIDKERNDYLTHIYEKEKRFDELLDIIPFNKI